jgi:hypothetical protein
MRWTATVTAVAASHRRPLRSAAISDHRRLRPLSRPRRAAQPSADYG